VHSLHTHNAFLSATLRANVLDSFAEASILPRRLYSQAPFANRMHACY
jgi:hypothetical protein